MPDLAFGLIVAITLGSAFMVVQGKQLLYSAIALLFTFFGVAGLYIFMWADFMAAVQIVIYIGGILVLLIFGIMLTNKITSVNISHTSLQRGAGVLVALNVIDQHITGHNFNCCASSIFTVCKLLNIFIIIARATAASAAAIMITKRAKTCPDRFMPPKRAKAIKLIFAEFNISSGYD